LKIGFWNVERLGKGTSAASKSVIANAIEWFFDHEDVELFVLCEITSSTTVTSSADTDMAIDKVGTIRRRVKKAASAQLGYAFVAKDGDFGGVASLVDIENFDETYEFRTHKKSGNSFKNLSKRGVLEFNRLFNGVDVYFFHANSSAHAPYLVAWVAEALRRRVAGKYPFVLIGDLNCQPSELTNLLKYYDHDELMGHGYSDSFKCRFAGNTHNARLGAHKVLDYAITGAGTAATVSSWDTLCFSTELGYADHPDHFPVVVQVG